MSLARAIFQITRPSSSLLTFLSVLIPVYVRTGDVQLSIRRAVPLLLVSMCTFIANDLDDAEKDRINHPQRPLASGQLTPEIAATIYFLCLIMALLSIRFYIGTNRVSFLYYAMLTTWTSYHYVVEYLSSLKALYVAAVSTLPILIIAAFFSNEMTLRYVVAALFFFMLGRELCKDLPDRPGDPKSRLHGVAAARIAKLAFTIEAIGLLVLALKSINTFAIAMLFAMTALLAIAYLCWFRWNRLLTALRLMQGILFLGLSFLL